MGRSKSLFGSDKEVLTMVIHHEQKYAGYGETMVGAKLKSFRPQVQQLSLQYAKEIQGLLQQGPAKAEQIAQSILNLPPLTSLKASLALLTGGMQFWVGFIQHLLVKFSKNPGQFLTQMMVIYDRVTNELISGQKSFQQIANELRNGGKKKVKRNGGKKKGQTQRRQKD